MFEIAVACLVITALLAYVNARFVGLPTTIGVMAVAMLLSLALIGLDRIGFGALRDYETSLLRSIDFSEVLMQGMLSMLLFAGALHVDLSRLRRFRWQIGLLAVVGTTLSTLIVGFGLHWVLPLLGLGMPLAYCLAFGALISPTDPVAVMGILKSAGINEETGMVVAGESLFNDGVGVVLFSLLLGIAVSGQTPSIAEGTMTLVHEAGGGIVLGAVLGGLLFTLLRSINNYQVEVLLTLAGVLGGYELASQLHVSGPLAMVVAGVIIGNHGRNLAMSDTTRRHVDLFWELLDEILNAVLFVLLGLEIVVIAYPHNGMLAAVAVVALTLLCAAADRRLADGQLQALVRPARRCLDDPDLERPAWRHLGGVGAVTAGRAVSRPDPGIDLCGRGVLDPGAGPDRQAAGQGGTVLSLWR